MNYNQGIEHLIWKFKNSWKPTATDIEALNSIIAFKEIQENKNLSENESLAKLWIHQFMYMCLTGSYTSKMACDRIDDILNKSVYDWVKQLNEEIPILKFNSIGIEKYPITTDNDLSKFTSRRLRNDNIINDYEKELLEAIKTPANEKSTIKFVEQQITRIINTKEK